jgi:hypothetical protein
MSEVLKALDGSIKKWEQIVASTDAIDHGWRNCPLCTLFNNATKHGNGVCRGCPVRDNTGDLYCDSSPYADWADHMAAHNSRDWSRIADCAECSRLALAELLYLQSLRAELIMEAMPEPRDSTVSEAPGQMNKYGSTAK